LKLLDLFSGIGGFHKGFEQAGFTFDWVGFSEIDKYASSVYKYKFPKSEELGDITTIRPENLPKDIDILCGGFPCQTFSIAGKRAGFNDTRGTLFFEIARILRYFRDIEKPIPYFILENVKGLLNHDNGRTFNTIYGVLTDLDYTVECQLLNTRWFLPQNRERIYLVGHLGNRSGHKVFPIGEDDKKTYELQGQSTNTITARYEGCGNGSYVIESELDAQKGLNQIGTIGKDSEATRVYDTTCARTIKNGGGMGAKTGLYQIGAERGRYNDKGKIEQQLEVRTDDVSNTLTGVEKDNRVISKSNIRRLTPTECERLQGFPDGWTEGQSDTQRYKQLGNAVTVNVVQAVGERIGEIK
jgi:DNA (cytosine-5)-methyltransferase 1